MIALIMAGGKGSRMNGSTEKLLQGKNGPLIEKVIQAISSSRLFEKIFAATSGNSPKTENFLINKGIEIIKTEGKGYVQDLNSILSKQKDTIFAVSGDLPLLDGEIIKLLIKKADSSKIWNTFLISSDFLNSLNLKNEYSIILNGQKCHYSGISLIDSEKINSLDSVEENYIIFDDKRIAFNINTIDDFELLYGT